MIHVPAAVDADLLSIVEFAVEEGWLQEPVSIIRFLERPSRFTDLLAAYDEELARSRQP